MNLAEQVFLRLNSYIHTEIFSNPNRRAGFQEVVTDYASRYGEERASAISEIADVIFWKNHQVGRHPLVPRGMVLDRMDDRLEDNGTKLVTYIPHELMVCLSNLVAMRNSSFGNNHDLSRSTVDKNYVTSV